MKATHRPDLFTWSHFDTVRDLDFNGYAWAGPEGVVLIDPMPMSAHDRRHLDRLGPIRWIVVTNSDHTRAADELSAALNVPLAGPAAEREGFPLACTRWLGEGEELLPGLRALALEGSKTPGELALWLGDTVICGDLVRGHVGGRLNLLPAAKLADREKALASVRRLAALPGLEAVLVGDGWSAFRDGPARLHELVAAAG